MGFGWCVAARSCEEPRCCVAGYFASAHVVPERVLFPHVLKRKSFGHRFPWDSKYLLRKVFFKIKKMNNDLFNPLFGRTPIAFVLI